MTRNIFLSVNVGVLLAYPNVGVLLAYPNVGVLLAYPTTAYFQWGLLTVIDRVYPVLLHHQNRVIRNHDSTFHITS